MGSGAPLVQAGKGGELQDTGDLGPRLATCSTGDNGGGTSSPPWSLSCRPHPSCAPKLSAARASLGPARIPQFLSAAPAALGGRGSRGRGATGNPKSRSQSAAWRRWACRSSGKSRRGASRRGIECRALQGGLRVGSWRWVFRKLRLRTCTGKGLQVEGVAWEKRESKGSQHGAAGPSARSRVNMLPLLPFFR